MEKSTIVKMTARFLSASRRNLKIGFVCGDSNNILDSNIRDVWVNFDVLVMTAGSFKKVLL